MDKILLTVSSNVSPFETDDAEAEKLIVSAESLFSASSKEILVRVEFSKKRFTIVTSRNDGTFLTGLCKTSLNCSAVCRKSDISSLVRSLIPRRCLAERLIKGRR